MPAGALSGTASFALQNTYVPPTSNNTNTTTAGTFTVGGITSTTNRSTGVVTPGLNASGSLNSASAAKAVAYAVSRGLADTSVTISLKSGTTVISKAAMQTLLNNADGLPLNIQINSAYGTITVPVSSARQIWTEVRSNTNAVASAKTTFAKAYGNKDIVGIQTAQASTFGSSATYRIDADSIGLSAYYGDTVYVAIYNPTTRLFTRKTVQVNSAGQIAFKSSYSGILLFSETPFTK
jgi:hypothetical protein